MAAILVIGILVVLILVVGGILFTHVLHKVSDGGAQDAHACSFKKSSSGASLSQYKIAVLVPALSSGAQSLIDGFEETLRQEGAFNFESRLYNPRGERTAMKSYIEDILDGPYDLVYCIGTEPTKMLREVALRRGKETPVVFSGVTDPVALGIVASEQHSGNNFTGVKAHFNFALEIRLLLALKEGIERALIIYDPSQLGGYAVRWKDEVEQLLENRKVKVKAIEIFNVDEIEEKVVPYIDVADVVLILRDHTAIAGMHHVSKLCNQHGVTLIVADLDGLKKGAALSFGFRDYDAGAMAARKARAILEQHKKPTDIPTTDVGENYRLLINADVLERQNLSIDSKKLFLMRYARVVGGDDHYVGAGEKELKR